MAWSIIKPTGPTAPCNPPDCAHRDCAEAVAIVRTVCPLCARVIGFDTKFCRTAYGVYQHFTCAVARIDAAR